MYQMFLSYVEITLMKKTDPSKLKSHMCGQKICNVHCLFATAREAYACNTSPIKWGMAALYVERTRITTNH